MENFKITTIQFINKEIELPEFFRVSDLHFIKIIDEKIHLHVTKAELKLELYPEIKIKSNRVLNWFEDYNWGEITEDEFWSAYFETKWSIEKLAEI